MKKNDFLNILGFVFLPFVAIALIFLLPLGMLYSYIVYKIQEKKK